MLKKNGIGDFFQNFLKVQQKIVFQEINEQKICPYPSEVFVRKALLVIISQRFSCSYAVLHFKYLYLVGAF